MLIAVSAMEEKIEEGIYTGLEGVHFPCKGLEMSSSSSREKEEKEKGWTIVVNEDKPNRITGVVQEQFWCSSERSHKQGLLLFLEGEDSCRLPSLAKHFLSPMSSDLCLFYYLLDNMLYSLSKEIWMKQSRRRGCCRFFHSISLYACLQAASLYNVAI